MTFPEKEAGWHVLIGDNGSGKSTILRAIAAALIGPNQIHAVNIIWEDWLSIGSKAGEIRLSLTPDWGFDEIGKGKPPKNKSIINQFSLEKKGDKKVVLKSNLDQERIPPSNYNWGENNGWFSVAYGPFRRFTGGDEKLNKVFYSSPKAGAHLSIFGEDVALTEALEWLNDLDNKRIRLKNKIVEESNFSIKEILDELYKAEEVETFNKILNEVPAEIKQQFNERFENSLKERVGELFIRENKLELNYREGKILHFIKEFINKSNLLPHNSQFDGFDINGNIKFVDGRGSQVKVIEMSDGYRTMLSMTFELIRQLIRVYGDNIVFKNIANEIMTIDVPGIVLIDEIDAHLHPTWQTKIGHWFIKYFPNLQFIVTTHSPLICRACENGSIWKLGDAGNNTPFEKVEGISKERLIYGNILDAYGTELFGSAAVRSKSSNTKLQRLGELNMLFALKKITEKEIKEREELLKILSTDDPTGF